MVSSRYGNKTENQSSPRDAKTKTKDAKDTAVGRVFTSAFPTFAGLEPFLALLAVDAVDSFRPRERLLKKIIGGVRKLAEYLKESLRVRVVPPEAFDLEAARRIQIRLDGS